MPISIDELESHDPEERETNAERIVRFLAENRDMAYKAIEIAEATAVDDNSIHPVLNRLEERGLVRHREPYRAIGDVEKVQDAVMFSSTSAFLDETLGPESREEWLRAAEDEERERERERAIVTGTIPPFDDLKRGPVVLAPDPFKPDDETTRPWFVVNNESHPFDKQQYVVMGLTTQTWYDERILLDEDDYDHRKAPRESSIVPHVVASIEPALMTDYVCRIRDAPLDEGVKTLVGYL